MKIIDKIKSLFEFNDDVDLTRRAVIKTAAEGAKKHLDQGRKPKIVEAFTEYTEHVKAEL